MNTNSLLKEKWIKHYIETAGVRVIPKEEKDKRNAELTTAVMQYLIQPELKEIAEGYWNFIESTLIPEVQRETIKNMGRTKTGSSASTGVSE